MKNVYQLIQLCRKQTENEEYSFNTGIQDEEFVQYLNDAQHNIQASIVKQHPRVFIEEKIIDVVVGQEKYDIPSDCFLGNKIFNIEYSSTGNEDDYYTLSKDIMKYRSSGVEGSPTKYIRISGKILLSPVPSGSGKIRVNYVKALPELRLPLGNISSVSHNSSTNLLRYYYTSKDLPNTVTTEDVKSDIAYSICSLKGDMLEQDLFTPTSYGGNYVEFSGNVPTEHTGSYFMPGNNSTFIPQLDSSIIRYLISYCNWKILKRDSSVDSQEAMQELSLMVQEIVSSYANISDDIQLIPQLNSWDDWSN